ncbi:MAG: bifunctional precorrin-2 dehydrogenase/sirohydrochlorin ferrochelatase [Bacilli bacterium]
MLVNLSLENKNILIVGGGKVGFRKAKKLLNYTNKIKVVSLDFAKEFEILDVELVKSEYSSEFLTDVDLIFLCTNNPSLHDKIINSIQDKKILINNSTSRTNMDFAMVNSFIDYGVEIAVTSDKGISDSKKIIDRIKKNLLRR